MIAKQKIKQGLTVADFNLQKHLLSNIYWLLLFFHCLTLTSNKCIQDPPVDLVKLLTDIAATTTPYLRFIKINEKRFEIGSLIIGRFI